MLLDDLVDIVLVHVGVPDLLGIDHDHRSLLATIQATRLIDAHLALAGELEGLDLRFCIVEHRLCIVVPTTGVAVFALIEAEKYMMLVKSHYRILVDVERNYKLRCAG